MRELNLRTGWWLRISAALAIALCSSGLAMAAKAPLNVVIVFWDTARYDHTTPAGYFRNTTPNLSAFAAKGLFFTNAFSQSDWTIPAVASLFTGRRPSSHGVVSAGDRLPEQMPTLAEVFRARGFNTAAFTTGVISATTGFERGFDTARNTQTRKEGSSSILQPEDDAIAWLKEHQDKPFFLLVHGNDAHYPYACPSERRGLFSDKTYHGPARALTVSHNFVAVYDRYREPEFLSKLSLAEWEQTQKVRSTPADLAELASQYDGCLSYEDSLLPRLTDSLAQLKLDKNTVVIVFSDHGESLGGHGGYGHLTRPLYNEVQHIVLAMRLPGNAAGRRVTAPVELIDLMPTLLGLEGWPAPPGLEGRDLVNLLRGAAPPPEPALWASAASRPTGWPKRLDLQALRYGGWKVLRDIQGWKLYNMKADPGEKQDLLSRQPNVFLDMASRLLSLSMPVTGAGPENKAAPDREHAGPPPEEASSYGNERQLLLLAGDQERRGDLAASEKACLAGLAAFPQETGLADILARLYFREGRWDELVTLRRKQVNDEAAAPAPLVIELAGALASARRYDEAQAVLRRADFAGRSASETALLRDKLTLLAGLKASDSPAPARVPGVSFARSGEGWTVSRPPWALKYSAPQKSFSLQRSGRPAVAGPESLKTEVSLAESLVDHVEELRFAAAPPAAAPPDDLTEKLKAAGYI